MKIRLPGVESGCFPVAGNHEEFVVGQAGVINRGLGWVVILQPHNLFGRQGKNIRDIPRLPVTDLDTERRNQDQPAEASRRPDRHFGSYPATERAADNNRIVEIILVEQIKVEIGQVVHRVDIGHIGRMTKAGMGRQDHPALIRQQSRKRSLRTRPVFSVQDEYRTALSVLIDFHARPPLSL